MVEGRHELVCGVERHLGDARICPAGEWGVDTDLGGEHNQRGLGRIADHLSGIGDGGIAVEAQSVGEQGEVGSGLARGLGDPTRLAVALTVDEVPPAMKV